MYSVLVFYDGSERPLARHVILSASDVATRLQEIMDAHPGCERAEVHVAGVRLFSIDCHGATTPG